MFLNDSTYPLESRQKFKKKCSSESNYFLLKKRKKECYIAAFIAIKYNINIKVEYIRIDLINCSYTIGK